MSPGSNTGSGLIDTVPSTLWSPCGLRAASRVPQRGACWCTGCVKRALGSPLERHVRWHLCLRVPLLRPAASLLHRLFARGCGRGSGRVLAGLAPFYSTFYCDSLPALSRQLLGTPSATRRSALDHVRRPVLPASSSSSHLVRHLPVPSPVQQFLPGSLPASTITRGLPTPPVSTLYMTVISCRPAIHPSTSSLLYRLCPPLLWPAMAHFAVAAPCPVPADIHPASRVSARLHDPALIEMLQVPVDEPLIGACLLPALARRSLILLTPLSSQTTWSTVSWPPCSLPWTSLGAVQATR